MTGLDFSRAAVDAARAAAEAAALDAHFVVGDVYDAAELLGREAFDVVYTGFGALTWLPDLDRWATVVADVLAPGGRLLLAEFHPFTTAFDDDLVARRPYAPGTSVEIDEAGTYVDLGAATHHNRARRWDHGLGRVVSSVAGARLVVENLQELDETWDRGERHSLVLDPDRGTYVFPPGMPSLPLVYTLTARKPRA